MLHCATERSHTLCGAECLSVFAELQDAVEEILPTLREQGISVYLLSEACSIQGINALSDKISQASDQPLSRDLRANVNIRSTALFIYTSGTTGTPGDSSEMSTDKVKAYSDSHKLSLLGTPS